MKYLHLYLHETRIKKLPKRIVISVINDLVTDYRVHRTCNTLIKSGAEVLLVGRKLPKSPELASRPYKIRRLNLIFSKGPFFYAEYNIRLFIFLLFTKADILVSNDLDTLTANYIASKIKKKPLVFDSHEYFTELPEVIDRKYVKKIWLFIEKLIIPNLKHCYTVSDSIAAEYKKNYGVTFAVIRNVSPYCEVGKELLNRVSKTILYQGALNKGRGIELAIKSMKYLDDYKLIIAGDGYIASELRNLADKENVSNKIVFTGRIPFENLFNISIQASVGLSIEEDIGLNYRYALPNKLFSYIQLRLPVIVSDLPEMSKIVNDYKIGHVLKARDSFLLAQNIREICENLNYIKELRKNLDIAARELCWENEENKLKDIYRKIGLVF